MYYPNTIAAIEAIFPGVQSVEHPQSKPCPEHILWMCEGIKNMDTTSLDAAFKAARWLGWILCAVEVMAEGWTNQISRDLVRQDVTQGYDRPHEVNV
jgi:hypothetical protein